MMRQYLILFLMLLATVTANAKPRTLAEMKQAAAKVLHESDTGTIRKAYRPIQVLQKHAGLYVMGYEDDGFAIVLEDDCFPEIVGYSESSYNPDTDNENFKWWLSQVKYMASHPVNTAIHSIQPDTTRFPAYVKPMVKTLWGQGEPYNNLCPLNFVTGCVATAAAQVLKYHQWPQYGHGEVFTYYPFGDYEGTKYEENIDGVEYLYDLMQNSYYGRAPTQSQKNAVATLMYHVGLGMKAQYMADGTGSYSAILSHALRHHFEYPYAISVEKDSYSVQDWMDMVFESLSNGCPLVYGGSDENYMGHEFVLHGYNSSGKVYINWGWEGSEDGYFDLSTLLLWGGFYDFNHYQDMLLRVNPALQYSTEYVHVDVPGSLEDIVGERRDSIISMVLSGSINSKDLKTLRYMAGSSVTGKGTMGNLSILDLSDVTIVSGGDSYLIEGEQEYTTDDDAIPYKAFSNCVKLINVTLPKNLIHYDIGVFSNCLNLDAVTLVASDDSEFVVDGCYVMNKERTEIIEGLPCSDLHYMIPHGITRIHDYAFAGRYLYERVSLPETVDSVGKYAFNRCYDLSRTYVYAANPPVIDESAIDDLDLSTRSLYVPKGAKMKYLNAEGWKKYGSKNIVEFEITDDIPDVNSDETPHHFYDLAGRKQPTIEAKELNRGVYISNGKKYIVK